MKIKHSLGTRAVAWLLSIMMILSLLPAAPVSADAEAEAMIGTTEYESLEEAIEAVPVGGDTPTTITLLTDVGASFNVGTEDGSAPKNIVLDLANDYTLTLEEAVGSDGTKSSGVRVLANSKLTVKNGKVVCSSDSAYNIKVGFSNYGTLKLDSVKLVPGALTIYGINNRGHLTLSGSTEIKDYKGGLFQFGVTNDPYNFIYPNQDAVVNCESSGVLVESMQVERYKRATSNAGGVKLNISAGTFGKIVEDGDSFIGVDYHISGGNIGSIGITDAAQLENLLKTVPNGTVIKLQKDMTLGFDVGVEDGSVSRNIILDLNNQTLTTAPSVGSAGTKTSGIRVLANSSLTLKNGKVVSPDEAGDTKVKVGIANYGKLNLESVKVIPGKETIYTINNRGDLTLSGSTTVHDGNGDHFQFAITNDPYNFVYTDRNAVLNVADAAVTVGKMQVERYPRATANVGGIVLNISAGTFGELVSDNGTAVNVTGNITGGVFANDVKEFVLEGYEAALQENGTYLVGKIKKEQAPLEFKGGNSAELVYVAGLTFKLPEILGGTTNGTVTYALDDKENAQVDAEGVVTFSKAGTFVIRATMAGNEEFKSVSADFTVTVIPGNREAHFERPSDTVYYGTATLTCPELKVGAGEGEITYEIVEGADIADVDQKGVLTFKDGGLGTVKVLATVAADGSYNACTAEYTVTVEYLPAPETAIQITGEKPGENGWFMGDVTITAPGYTISESNSFAGEWVESIPCTEEGTTTKKLYLKDAQGQITDAIEVTVKIDKTVPAELDIEYSKYTWMDAAKDFFGGNSTVTVTFHFVENGSGPAKVAYSLDGGENYIDAVETEGVYTANVDPEYRGHVRFYVKDQAGWEAEVLEDGSLLIVDQIAPHISVAYEGEKYYEETVKVDENKENVIVTTADQTFKLTFTVTDENYDVVESNPILTVNGEAAEVTWTKLEDGKGCQSSTLELTAEGTYLIRVEGTDRSNVGVAERTIIVDRTDPKLNVDTVTAPVRTDDKNVAYYGSKEANKVQIALVVDELNFAASRTGFEIELDGEAIKPEDFERAGIILSETWELAEDGYRNVLTFENAEEGEYAVRVAYTVGGGNMTQTLRSESLEFVIDRTAPGATISYQEEGEGLFDAMLDGLGKLLFGKEKVDVTITVSDGLSGIYALTYDIGDGSPKTVEAAALTGNSYTFSIDAQYRNKVAVTVEDMAKNTKTVTSTETLIIDKTQAEFSVGCSGAASFTEGTAEFTTADRDFKLVFQVKHENFDVHQSKPVVEYKAAGNIKDWKQVPAELVTVALTESEDYNGTITVGLPQEIIDSKEGEYEFRCTYALFDGWTYGSSATALVNYDTVSPALGFSYNEDAAKKTETVDYGNGQKETFQYFYDELPVTIQVTERHFDKTNVDLRVEYKASMDGKYQDWEELKNSNWWHGENYQHEFRMTFREEGYYRVTMSCADTLTPNAASSLAQTFVVDKTDPVISEISYGQDLAWYEILGQMFGFPIANEDGDVTATWTVTDAVSGIDKVTYSTDGSDFKTITEADGKYTLTLPNGFRNKLTVHAEDGAGHECGYAEQGAIVVDAVAPTVTAEYTNEKQYDSEPNTIFTNQQTFDISFRVTDENYDLRAKEAVVMVGEVEQYLTWSACADGTLGGVSSPVTLADEGSYLISAVFADRSNNEGTWSKTVVVDRTAPVVEVSFDENQRVNKEDGIYFKTAPQNITIRVEEPNFMAELVELTLTGGADFDWNAYAKNPENWKTEADGVYTLTIELTEDAKYELEVSCQDKAGNETSTGKRAIYVDTVAPEVAKISYNSSAFAKVLENLTLGFFQASVDVTIEAEDAISGVKTISYKAEGKKGLNNAEAVALEGTESPTDGKLTFTIDQAFYGTITATAVDYATNETQVNVGYVEDQELTEIVVDGEPTTCTITTDPQQAVQVVEIESENVHFFNTDATAIIELTEDNFYSDNYEVMVNGVSKGVDWTSNGNVHTTTVEVEEDGDYTIQVSGADNSGNAMTAYATERFVVDKTAPKINISYFKLVEQNGEEVREPVDEAELRENPDRDVPVYAHVTIQDHNFRAEDVDILVTAKNAAGKDVLNLAQDYLNQGRTQNGKNETEPGKWSAYQSEWRREDDTYAIDLAFNMDATYTFRIAYEDLAKNPVETEEIQYTVDNENPVIAIGGIADGAFYSDPDGRTVTIDIQEENFNAEGVEFFLTGVDAMRNAVEFKVPDLNDPDVWTTNEDKNFYSVQFTLDVDANYSMKLGYTDPSGRAADINGVVGAKEFNANFTLDRVKPEGLSMSYSGVVQEKDNVLYYNDAATVTLTATDLTAANMTFNITLTPDQEFQAATDWTVPPVLSISSDTNLDELNLNLLGAGSKLQIHTAETNAPIEQNGTMTLKLVFQEQFRGDIAFEAVDKAEKDASCENNLQIAVDTIAPTLSVELPDAVTHDTEKDIRYYGGDMTATFTMTEANFYSADPVFTVNEQVKPLTWTKVEGDKVYTSSYTLTDEADYVLGLTYTDRSGNKRVEYTSETITIDRTAPKIAVKYDLVNPMSVHEGREYYADVRTATITVTEHNFVAEEVKFDITAKDVSGNDVAGPVFGKWESKDDVHTLVLTYANDANYTFDVSYTDKSGNPAAEYDMDQFTVDKTVPANVTISYSTSVLDTALNKLSFGFYKAKVNVTLRAEDHTAGIEKFIYSYVTANGVSGVNSGKENQEVAAVRTEANGKVWTANFAIPMEALNNRNQFNGTVTATAVDRSQNKTTVENNKRIVVDNISPTAVITYNDPYQTVNGTAYYAKQIDATIRINEANFYSDDVQVNVTRDGVTSRIQPKWNDQNTDVHLGTFTLDTEGDYVVSVTYADKSGNAMASYASGKMVIDQAAPTIHVANIVADSANEDEVYTFAITVDDADGNMTADGIHPVLTAVVRDENGSHVTKEIELPKAVVTAAGKTYVYTVQNLEEDAIYTLRCTAADLAGNTTNAVVLDDGTSNETVRFSINRNGSTFTYGTEETAELANAYFVQTVDNDVVIHEINVDSVSEYHVVLNGVELQEGDGFTTTITGGGSQWSLREYVIPADRFAEEGEYNIVISSVDATKSVAYSDLKGLSMNFVVDRTAPSVVIGGMEEGGRYEGEKQIVKIIPSDEGGRLGKVEVRLYEDGANVDTAVPKEILFTMEGEDLLDYLDANKGEIVLTIPEGYQQSVVIVCEDMASGTEGETNVYTQVIRNVTVSSNPWIIFLANKPALYSTIGGLLALICIIIFFVVKRRKKNEEKKA